MVVSRREALKSLGNGFGTLALAGVLRDAGLLVAQANAGMHDADQSLAPRNGHFRVKARAVIQLFQN